MYCIKLNQVTRLFAFPIPPWDDAVQEIDIKYKYFIVVDMDSVYWKLVEEE